jgi:hypothetical protein
MSGVRRYMRCTSARAAGALGGGARGPPPTAPRTVAASRQHWKGSSVGQHAGTARPCASVKRLEGVQGVAVCSILDPCVTCCHATAVQPQRPHEPASHLQPPQVLVGQLRESVARCSAAGLQPLLVPRQLAHVPALREAKQAQASDIVSMAIRSLHACTVMPIA